MLSKCKTGIVSGAAVPRGLGLATPRLFASHGTRVAILDLDLNLALEASASLGHGHIDPRCDDTDSTACWSARDTALGRFGRIDILINNAGMTEPVKTMAREFGPNGIRVNCVTPGLIETDTTGDKLAPEMKAETIKEIPLGRLGAASNLANVPRSSHRSARPMSAAPCLT